jgi:hypothetical protein
VVVDQVEDLEDDAVCHFHVGDVALPALVGEVGLEADPTRLRSFLGFGVMKPRARSPRWMVETEGTMALVARS